MIINTSAKSQASVRGGKEEESEQKFRSGLKEGTFTSLFLEQDTWTKLRLNLQQRLELLLGREGGIPLLIGIGISIRVGWEVEGKDLTDNTVSLLQTEKKKFMKSH